MAEESKSGEEEKAAESAGDKQRREARLASFYQRPKEEPAGQSPKGDKPKAPSLTDPDPVFRQEFNTIGYLSIGFSLIALLLIVIIFFRPPKPEAELSALTEVQTQTRETLEKLAGHVAALDRRAESSTRHDLVRSLRVTHLALESLKQQGNQEMRSEAEALQTQIEALLEEVEGGSRPGSRP